MRCSTQASTVLGDIFDEDETVTVANEQSNAFLRLGDAFARGGRSYDRLRPGYPADAVAFLVEGLRAGSEAVDIGAGTGKLSAALVALGLSVIAVDPSPDMLAQLSRQLPAATAQLGTGEQTGLRDGAVDLATFAQSWHWVEPTAGVAELARILKPGGRAGWVWNFMDTRVDWVGELASIWHTLAGDEAVDATRHQPTLEPPFGPVEATTIDWVVPMEFGNLAELVTTRSYYLEASNAEQRHIRTQVNIFLGSRFADRPVIGLPYRTHCFRASLNPDGRDTNRSDW